MYHTQTVSDQQSAISFQPLKASSLVIPTFPGELSGPAVKRLQFEYHTPFTTPLQPELCRYCLTAVRNVLRIIFGDRNAL
jgi:hypothetical protein